LTGNEGFNVSFFGHVGPDKQRLAAGILNQLGNLRTFFCPAR
jgi:hypothetical protein